MMYVYRIQHKNKPDMPRYYGKTANIFARWAAHKTSGGGLNRSFIALAFGHWGSGEFECHILAKHKDEFVACCHEERLIWTDFMACRPLYNQNPIGPLGTGRFLIGIIPRKAQKSLGIPRCALRIRLIKTKSPRAASGSPSWQKLRVRLFLRKRSVSVAGIIEAMFPRPSEANALRFAMVWGWVND